MADPTLEDLGARLIAVARAMASAADRGMDDLRGALPSDVADRLQDTREAIESAATGLQQRAQDELEATRLRVQSAQEQANAQLQQTTEQLQAQLDRTVTEADRAIAAAEAGLQQAGAVGDQAVAEATATKEAAVSAAEKAKAAAQQVFEDGAARARALSDEAVAQASRALDEAQAAFDAAKAQVLAAADQAQHAIDDAAAAVAGLPDDAMALGQDVLDRIEGALTWPSGILSLLAKVLIWLKKECFGDVDELQVVWHEPADGPVGLGLQWVENDRMLRLVYRPPTPPEVGAGSLLIETRGTGTQTIAGAGVTLSFHGQADQRVVVGKGLPGPEPGAGDCSLVVAFPALAFSKRVGPLTAEVASPTLTASLTHAGFWSYGVELDLPSYGAALGLSDALAQAGLQLPISLPSIKETRSLHLAVADGTFTAREGAPA